MRILISAGLLILTACSGGSGGSSSSSSDGSGTTPTTPASYSLSGTISGLRSPFLVLTNGSTSLPIAANATSFSFGQLTAGTSYSVEVAPQQSLREICSVTNGAGTLNSDITDIQIHCETVSTGSVDLTHLPLGTPNIRLANQGAAPEKFTLLLCGLPPDGAGAVISNDWVNEDGTWDHTRKPHVDGAVPWNSRIAVTLNGNQRMISGNALPSLPTGVFPVDPDSVAYQYDRNPSSIGEHTVDLTMAAIPSKLDAPRCLPYGATGIAMDGAAIYHGASTLGTDAAASEMLDDCGGQADGSNTYHYHYLTPCQLAKFDPPAPGHSALMGYMMDGFGIFGPRGEDGNVLSSADLDECHGHEHNINWDGKEQTLYHYHWTYDFPYNVGCFRANPVSPWNGPMNHNH